MPTLNRSDFTLTEEKVRQEIISFSHETCLPGPRCGSQREHEA